jgi:hypothetical protein
MLFSAGWGTKEAEHFFLCTAWGLGEGRQYFFACLVLAWPADYWQESMCWYFVCDPCFVNIDVFLLIKGWASMCSIPQHSAAWENIGVWTIILIIHTVNTGFSVLCEALANGNEAMAIDIISTNRIYKFGWVHIIEMWLNVKALANLGGVEWKSLAKFAVRRPKLKTLVNMAILLQKNVDQFIS